MTTITPRTKVKDFDHVVKICVAVLETVPDSHLIPILSYINAAMLIPYCEGENPTTSVVRIEELTEAFYAAINCGEDA